MRGRTLYSRMLATGTLLAGFAFGSAATAGPDLLAIGFGDNKLYDVNTSTALATNPRNTQAKLNMISFAPNGVLGGVSQGFPSDIPPGGGLFTINVANGTPTQVATMTEMVVTEGDIAFDPTTGKLYAVDGAGLLFTVNTTTGVGTTVGTVPGNVDLSAMAFDGLGNLYIVDQFGPTLLEIDKLTAAILTSTPMSPVETQVGGLAFDPSDGTLYYAGGYPNPKLYSLDPSSGAATLVGSLAITGGVGGLTFAPLDESVGVVKEFTNTTGLTADGVDITLVGTYSTVLAHFDGLPVHKFTGFTLLPAGSNTILRWTGGTTIPPGDKVSLGFLVLGTQYQLAAVQWKSAGVVIGAGDQVNVVPHLTSAGSVSVAFDNTLSGSLHGAMYVRDVSIEYHDHAIAIPFLQAGIDRQPLRTDAFPVPPTPIAEGGSLTLPAGTPPAGATHAVLVFTVASQSNLGQASATTDVAIAPLTPLAVPALGGGGLALVALLLLGASRGRVGELN